MEWFHVRIRDLLTLTLICAILAAWWSDRTRLKEDAERANELAERLRADAELANALALINRDLAERYDQAFSQTSAPTTA